MRTLLILIAVICLGSFDAWGGEGLVAGRFAADLPANHEPAERPTLVMPRLVELAFQTAGLRLLDLGEILYRGKHRSGQTCRFEKPA